MSMAGQAAASYAATLNDPFTHPGVKIGFGCMVPSSISMAYVRTAITANADGTATFFAWPTIGAGTNKSLYTNVSGHAGTTWNGVATYNSSVTNNTYAQGRIVSFGLKATPMVPGTAAPGVVYAGACPACKLSTMVSLSNDAISGSPFAKVGMGYGGGVALGRPQDTSAFIFTPDTINGAGDISTWSIPFLAFSGLPASTAIIIECVYNFEGLTNLALSAPMGAGPTEGSTPPSLLSRAFASIEQLWNYVQPQLSDPGTVRTIHAIASQLSGTSTTSRARLFADVSNSPSITVVDD